jgi:acetyl-CoA carboxylase biotin carboxyl carrier protein
MATSSDKTSKREGSTPVNLKSLKKIVTIMNRAQLTELHIEQDGIKILLRKGPLAGEGVQTVVSAAPLSMLPAAAPAVSAPPPAAAPVAPPVEDANVYTITSPMVGTFYRSPAPEAAPYVSEGSAVDNNAVVCIIEAMKLMNEIKSDVKGVIKKILVDNAQAVEFGQPLFLVERKA